MLCNCKAISARVTYVLPRSPIDPIAPEPAITTGNPDVAEVAGVERAVVFWIPIRDIIEIVDVRVARFRVASFRVAPTVIIAGRIRLQVGRSMVGIQCVRLNRPISMKRPN